MDIRAVATNRTSSGAWRVLLCALAVATTVLGGVSPAAAHVRTHGDADDVSGPLDLRRVGLDREGGLVTATMRTYDRLRDRHFISGSAFFVKLDTRGGPRPDFTLRMDYYEGAYPYCTLYDRDGFSRYGAQATKGRRSFSCSLPFAEFEATRHIRWRVVTASSAGPVDRAPGRGWFSH